MAYLDNELIFMNDEAAAASMTSAVLDLGTKGGNVHPLFIDVKLTKAMTSGKMDTITVQSAATEAFSSPVTEMTVTVPASINQTAAPATLAQFFAPIKTSNRYVRITMAGTSPVGGKVSAYMTSGIAVGL